MFVLVTPKTFPVRNLSALPEKSALRPPLKKMCTKCDCSGAANASRTKGPAIREPIIAPPAASAPLRIPRRESLGFIIASERQEVAGGEDRRADVSPLASCIRLGLELLRRELDASIDLGRLRALGPRLSH